MKQHIRYGEKQADGTVKWGDWQECGGVIDVTYGNDTLTVEMADGTSKEYTIATVAEITTEEIQEIFKEVYGR